MKTTKLFSVAVLLIMLICVKGFAQDGDDKIVGKATDRAASMTKQFKLSDEQNKSLYDLFVSTMQKENTLYKSGKSRLDMEAGKDAIHQDFYNGVKGIFTEKQFEKFNKPETKKSIEEGAKWRSLKMQTNLDLTKKQKKSVYNLIVSTTKQQNALVRPAEGDRTEYYNARIKLADEFYSEIKNILTADQLAKYNVNDY